MMKLDRLRLTGSEQQVVAGSLDQEHSTTASSDDDTGAQNARQYTISARA